MTKLKPSRTLKIRLFLLNTIPWGIIAWVIYFWGDYVPQTILERAFVVVLGFIVCFPVLLAVLSDIGYVLNWLEKEPEEGGANE